MRRACSSYVALLAIVVVSSLVVTPMGAVTIDETIVGEDTVDIVFPQDGGTSTDLRFSIPLGGHVESATLDLEGKYVTWDGSVTHADQADLGAGEAVNVTVVDGVVLLQGDDGTWLSPVAWAGADLENVTVDGGSGAAILENLAQEGFLPATKVDTTGIMDEGISDIAVDQDGDVHVVYMRSEEVVIYMRSTDGGDTWEQKKSIGSIGGGAFYWNPSVHVGPDGNIYIFVEESLMGGSRFHFYRSEDGGDSFVEKDWGIYPLDVHVAWDSGGTMHFVGRMTQMWPISERITYWNSTDDGDTISTVIQISNPTYDDSFKTPPKVAVDPDDMLHVIWGDARDTSDWMYQEVFYTNTSDQAHFTTDRKVEARDSVELADVNIGADSAGVLHLMWADDRTGDWDVYYTSSDDSGDTFASSVSINPTTTNDQYNPEMVIDSDDTVHASWEDNKDSTGGDIAYMTSTDGGQTFGDYAIANDEVDQTQRDAEMAVGPAPDHRPHLIWSDSRDGTWHEYFTRMGTMFHENGNITGHADLGVQPHSIDGVLVNANVPGNTTVIVKIRTSTDDATWSDWETVDLDDDTIASPPGRYVDWRITLHTDTGASTPSVSNISIDHSYYLPEGTYTSKLIRPAHAVVQLTPTWVATEEGQLDVSISNDNGTTWLPATKGEEVVFPAAGDEIRYNVVMSSEGNVTPELDSVTLDLGARVYASGIELFVGPDSVADWSHEEALDTKVTVDITDTLRTVLEAMGGSAGDAQVTIRISSATAGNITVSNISIVLDLPPEIKEYAPAIDPSVDEDNTLNLSVTAEDPDGDTLTYTWYLDGVQVGTDGPNHTYAPGFEDAGAHTIRVDVTDGRFTVNHTWDMAVVDVNRRPTVVSITPATIDVEVTEGDALKFGIDATDPDGDALTYKWLIDGSEVAGATEANWTLDHSLTPAPGNFEVTVRVSDGVLWEERTWNLTTKERIVGPPKIDSYSPTGEVTIRKGKTVDLSVVASHPESLPLTYTWYLDGTVITGATGSTLTFEGTEVGAHDLKVVVSDGKSTPVDHSWVVTVKKKAEGGTGDEFAGMPLWALLALIVVIIVVIAAALLMMRGKGAGKEDSGGAGQQHQSQQEEEKEGEEE